MLVAVVALVSSLAGGAVAASLITGDDIKNGSITKKDLKKNSVRSKKVKNGSLKTKDFGADLPAGPRGPEGPKGEQGPPGADGTDGGNDAATVNGIRLVKFQFRGDAASAPQEEPVLNNFGGLTLLAACSIDDFDFTARNDSGETAEVVYNKVANATATSGAASTLPAGGTLLGLGAVPDDNVTAQLTFKTASDDIVTVTFSLDENASAPRCSATGTAIAG